MNVTLKVQPEALRAKAQEVEGDVRTLRQQFDSIQDIVSRSSGYWAGDAGDRARREFSGQKESIAKVIRRFQEHPGDLMAMAGVYDETEKALSQENKKLATDVIA